MKQKADFASIKTGRFDSPHSEIRGCHHANVLAYHFYLPSDQYVAVHLGSFGLVRFPHAGPRSGSAVSISILYARAPFMSLCSDTTKPVQRDSRNGLPESSLGKRNRSESKPPTLNFLGLLITNPFWKILIVFVAYSTSSEPISKQRKLTGIGS